MGLRNIIAIGGSLGGIDAVRLVLRHLPPDFPGVIFLVLHVGARGRNYLAEIFAEGSSLPVSTALHGEAWEQGRVYVAPADHHMLVMDGRICLGRGPKENFARPAIDPLFRSVAATFGPSGVGVILTGLLNDGAAGLSAIKRCGGTAIVQDPADAAASQMPREALLATHVDHKVSVEKIAGLLVELAGQEAGPPSIAPADISSELSIARNERTDSDVLAGFADPVALSCPACGGVLSQVREAMPLRFRCQVGHAFTAEALAEESDSTVDEAVRVALRIMEERSVLTRKMADDARRSGRPAAAEVYENRLAESRAHAATLRRALELGPSDK